MTISYSDFQKMDIKIAKIKSAERVPNTDKLIKMEIDIGDETRQIVAGIGEVYETDDLVDKQIPVLVNLEPRKIKGIESNGMLLAVVVDGKPILLEPDKEVPNGSKIM